MGNILYYLSPLGRIGITEAGGELTNIFFETDVAPAEDFEEKSTAVLEKARHELEEYFNGERRDFDLPLAPSGTDFMRHDWQALLEIPYGETRSYKEIAEAIGRPKAYRAVGLANNKNPIAIIIPCHRVIGANGSLVGYGGGLHLKKYLLDLEQRYK